MVFHLLESGISGAQLALLNSEGTSVLIDNVSLAKHLEQRPIIVYPDSSRLEFAGVHRWAEPLEEGVSRLLMDQLAVDLNTSRISFLRIAKGSDWNYRVGYHIDRLGGTLAGTVQVRVNWWVRGGTDKTILRQENSLYEVQVDGSLNDIDAYVSAIQKVLQLWAEDVVATIRDARG